MQTYLTETEDGTQTGQDITADGFPDTERQVPAGMIVIGRLYKRT